MAIKIRIPRTHWRGGPAWLDTLAHPAVRAGVAAFIIVCLISFGIFAFYYVKYQKIVDARMRGPIFNTSAQIYARPQVLEIGEKISPEAIITELRRAGYSDENPQHASAVPARAHGEQASDQPKKPQAKSRIGTFRLHQSELEIEPGPDSYHTAETAVLRFTKDALTEIHDAQGHQLDGYELEPLMVTSLTDGQERAKRRVVTYNDIPKVLVDAVTSIEDRRFFQHNGVNYFRFMEAAWADLRTGRRAQGGSTLTMQVARGFFLSPEKTLKRKAVEMLIAVELEQRFSKQQIFALYANQIDMGQRGSFAIKGLAEASRAYFNKDISELTLPEAALLAGIIQRPSYLSPYRHPERALDRRNLVLDAMVETGAITKAQAETAKATPLKLAPLNVEASDAPYFVDLIKETLDQRYNENEINAREYHIYTTLDTALQKAAADAVDKGIQGVDEQVRKLRTRRVKVGKGKSAKWETKVLPGPEPQVALVAMDPHTGEVLALVGGRNYGQSQLNHAVAKRPTGSIFKPFVFAAAVNTAVTGGPNVFTATSSIDDSPGTYSYGDEIYEPRNYKEEYKGLVTARYALALSLNNATVKLAEQVGYENVAGLARAAGITSVKATPAMALGAYDATPLEMAQAYTIFANGGTRVSPLTIKSVRDAHGNVIEESRVQLKPVLDPRVAYVVTNMMEGVLNFGTAYPVRARGFTAPAAGKTGSSHDAWFAGYTSNLLCIVWVGYDDYTDIRLSGAMLAAPIWADFMKRAVALPDYADPKPFNPPAGVVTLKLDKVTNLVATPGCPDDYTAAFIEGTQPNETCDQANGQAGILQKIGHLFGGSDNNGAPKGVVPPPPAGQQQSPQPMPNTAINQPPGGAQNTANANGQQQQPDDKKKKGFWGKLAGVFKDEGDQQQQQPQQQPQPPKPH